MPLNNVLEWPTCRSLRTRGLNVRRQPDRLNERAVARGVPGSKPHPDLPAGVERNRKVFRAKRSEIRRGYHLTVDFFSVAPHDFDEVQREGPLDVGRDRPPGA